MAGSRRHARLCRHQYGRQYHAVRVLVGGAVILQVKSLSDTSIQRTGANNLTSAIPLGTATGNARPAATTVPSLAANAIDLRMSTSKTAASADYAVLQEMTVEYMG